MVCISYCVLGDTEEFVWLKDILPQYFSVKKSLYHYWYTSETHYKTHLLSDEVNIKKYFYALRPLLAAKWIMDKKSAPPMLFEELMEEELEAELVPEISRLLDMKKTLPEMGKAPKIQSINVYIERELREIKAAAEGIEEQAVEWDDLDKLFLRMVISQ